MINGTSTSTGCDSGALVVAGGVGIGGNLNVCGSFSGSSFNTNEAACNLSVGDNTNNVNNGFIGVTAIGEGALQNNIGSANTALGCNALNSNLQGNDDVAVGYKALINNTGGSNNVAIGQQAMLNNIGGNQNVSIGSLTLSNDTNSSSNTVVGFLAMQLSTGCSSNTSIGSNAMRRASSSSTNVAIGISPMQSITGCTNNVAVGNAAMAIAISGSGNVAVGSQALNIFASATNNIAIGFSSMGNVSQCAENVALGTFALDHVIGSNNVAIGNRAMQNTTRASGNIALGQNALQNGVSGFNIAIGTNAGQNLNANESNDIYIGHMGVKGESNTIRIGTNGNQSGCFIAGIFNAATGAGYAPVYINSSNQLAAAASSRNYKKDIKSLDGQREKMLKIRPVSFTYKHDPQNNTQFGLIAEEVNEIYPELIVRDEAGEIFTINYIELIPLLIKNIHELECQLETQHLDHELQLEDHAEQIKELKACVAQVGAAIKAAV